MYPKITQVLSILGGLCSVTMAYLIPCYSYVKLSKHRWFHSSNLPAILFFGALILIGFTSVGITVVELVTGVAYIGTRPDIINA